MECTGTKYIAEKLSGSVHWFTILTGQSFGHVGGTALAGRLNDILRFGIEVVYSLNHVLLLLPGID